MKNKIYYMGKIIGELDEEENCFYSTRTPDHIFHIFGEGIGLSEKVIDFLMDKNCERMVISFQNRLLWVYLVEFVTKGNQYKNIEKGKEDLQLIIPFKFWRKEDEIEKRV